MSVFSDWMRLSRSFTCEMSALILVSVVTPRLVRPREMRSDSWRKVCSVLMLFPRARVELGSSEAAEKDAQTSSSLSKKLPVSEGSPNRR